MRGCQQLLKEENPKIIYVHCFAHRLNLVLVSLACKIRHVPNFFNFLQDIYSFFSTSVVHSRFINAQKQRSPTTQPKKLKALSNTRWNCRHESVRALIETFQAVIDVLIYTEVDDVSGDRQGREAAILNQFDGNFVVFLFVARVIFRALNEASVALQKENMTINKALRVTDDLKVFLLSVDDELWKTAIWEPALEMCNRCEIEFLPARTIRRRASKIDSHKDMKISSFKCALNELDNRFLESQNRALLDAIESFNPSSDNFLDFNVIKPFFDHYEIAIEKLPENTKRKDMIGLLIFFAEHTEVFHSMWTAVAIACSIPCSTGSAERAFTSMGRIKTFLRSRTSDQRLNDLTVLFVNKRIVSNLSIEELVDDFADVKERRIKL